MNLENHWKPERALAHSNAHAHEQAFASMQDYPKIKSALMKGSGEPKLPGLDIVDDKKFPELTKNSLESHIARDKKFPEKGDKGESKDLSKRHDSQGEGDKKFPEKGDKGESKDLSKRQDSHGEGDKKFPEATKADEIKQAGLGRVPPESKPSASPTEAPAAPPTEAPVKPPTEAPAAPPTEAPVKPPTEAPVKPPTEAPAAPPTTPPIEAPGQTRCPQVGESDSGGYRCGF